MFTNTGNPTHDNLTKEIAPTPFWRKNVEEFCDNMLALERQTQDEVYLTFNDILKTRKKKEVMQLERELEVCYETIGDLTKRKSDALAWIERLERLENIPGMDTPIE